MYIDRPGLPSGNPLGVVFSSNFRVSFGVEIVITPEYVAFQALYVTIGDCLATFHS